MAEEKAPVASDERKGFFAKKTSSDAPYDEKVPHSNPTEVKQADPEQVASVSFTQLFRSAKFFGIFRRQCSPTSRYSTKFEIFLDVIGIITAAGAGAAQVCLCFLAASEGGPNVIAVSLSCLYFLET